MKRPIVIWLLITLFGSACASVPSPTPTPVPSPTTLYTAPPTLTKTPISTSTLIPTSIPTIQFTATPIPFSPTRLVPMTLMLHPSTDVFNAVEFLRNFIPILQTNSIRVITYQNIINDPDITAREEGKLAIITIDDIYLGSRNGLNYSIQEMIDLLCEANYPAVLGVVTQGEPNPTAVATLKDLLDKGWEIATHTDTHPNLGILSPPEAYREISTSQEKIERLFSYRPITLILPYGQQFNNQTVVKSAGIVWLVGIGGGETYHVNDCVKYVGREGPAGDPQKPFKS